LLKATKKKLNKISIQSSNFFRNKILSCVILLEIRNHFTKLKSITRIISSTRVCHSNFNKSEIFNKSGLYENLFLMINECLTRMRFGKIYELPYNI